MILYDHPASGNCMKARILLRQLDRPYERVTVDLFTGETRTPEHFGRNPDGRVPVLELDSGETIPESGAILTYLGSGTAYLPEAPIGRARVAQWMLFEQNRIEAELAYARFLKLSGRHEQMPEVYANRLERGSDALAALDRGLSDGRDVPRRRLLHRRHRRVRVRALRAGRRRGPQPARSRRFMDRARGGHAGVRERPRAAARPRPAAPGLTPTDASGTEAGPSST